MSVNQGSDTVVRYTLLLLSLPFAIVLARYLLGKIPGPLYNCLFSYLTIRSGRAVQLRSAVCVAVPRYIIPPNPSDQTDTNTSDLAKKLGRIESRKTPLQSRKKDEP